MLTLTMGASADFQLGDQVRMLSPYRPPENWVRRAGDWIKGRDLEDPNRRFTITAIVSSTMTLERAA